MATPIGMASRAHFEAIFLRPAHRRQASPDKVRISAHINHSHPLDTKLDNIIAQLAAHDAKLAEHTKIITEKLDAHEAKLKDISADLMMVIQATCKPAIDDTSGIDGSINSNSSDASSSCYDDGYEPAGYLYAQGNGRYSFTQGNGNDNPDHSKVSASSGLVLTRPPPGIARPVIDLDSDTEVEMDAPAVLRGHAPEQTEVDNPSWELFCLEHGILRSGQLPGDDQFYGFQ